MSRRSRRNGIDLAEFFVVSEIGTSADNAKIGQVVHTISIASKNTLTYAARVHSISKDGTVFCCDDDRPRHDWTSDFPMVTYSWSKRHHALEISGNDRAPTVLTTIIDYKREHWADWVQHDVCPVLEIRVPE